MPRLLEEKLLAVFRGRLALGLLGVVGVTFSVLVAGLLRHNETTMLQKEVERRADLRHALLRASLHNLDEALFSLRVLIQGSQEISSDEFQQAAESIVKRVGGVQALEWVPLVPADDLDAFVRRCRERISPDFTPRERDQDGNLRLVSASPIRPERALIAYLYPTTNNLNALGYDILTAPTAETLAKARSRPGEGALSASFHLVQGGEGMVYALYVTRDQTGVPAPEGGDGFLQVVVRLDEAFEEFFAMATNAVHDTLIVDITGQPTPLLLHMPDAKTSTQVRPKADLADYSTRYSVHRDLAFGGRIWRIYFRPTEAWLDSRRTLAPLLSLVHGILLTGLGIAYLHTLRRQAARISQEVAQRTAQLAESRALLDEITDHNPSSIWVKDASLRYQLVNLSFAASHRRPRAELLGKTDADLHPPDIARGMRDLDTRILASGETVSFEESYDMPERRRTYLVTKFPLRRGDGSIYAVAGIATDITALRDAESRHLSVERKLLEAQKLESLGVLAGGIAHDFNNLLTGILGHANLLREQLAPTDAAQPSLAQIEHASYRAADLCRQMLAYSGRGRLASQQVELGALVRDTTALLNLSLARRARLHFDLAPQLPAVVADVTQIRQIVMNLVINASEALVDGSGDITLRTRLVHAEAALFANCVFAPDLPSGDYVVLEVQDSGCGMAESVQHRIFDPFFSTKFTGRGLGLAAVLGIVRGHHGALQVDSEIGRGTTFRIYLPAARGGAPAAPRPRPPERRSAHSHPKRALHLLLVDDDPAVRESTCVLLKAAGHDVKAFEEGEHALHYFASDNRAYHAAILDLTMPGLGGVALMQRLRKERPDFPILLISGYTDAESAGTTLIATPRVAFLAKPFTYSQLQGQLDELLAPAVEPAPDQAPSVS